MRLFVALVLFYLASGVATNAFLFHLPVWIYRLDPRAERLRIASAVPPLRAMLEAGDPDGAERAVGLGIVILWPLFVLPLLRWMSALERPPGPG